MSDTPMYLTSQVCRGPDDLLHDDIEDVVAMEISLLCMRRTALSTGVVAPARPTCLRFETLTMDPVSLTGRRWDPMNS